MKPVSEFNPGTRSAPMPDVRVVTFRPLGNGYGTVECNWEDEARKGPIAESSVQKFAEGWHAKLKIAGKW